MTADERAEAIDASVVTDLESAGERVHAVLDRGRRRLRDRFSNSVA